MGDVAMVVPVLRAFTQQYPKVQLTVLTRATFKPVFRDIENITVFSADVKGTHKGVFGLYKLARQLNKKQRFYTIADLHSVLRSKILKRFLKCKRFISIDKGRAEKKALVKGEIYRQLKATHQRYADVFECLGYKIDLSNPVFPEKIRLSETILKLIGKNTKKYIGIAPFAAHEGKMYPLELMKQVIERLSKNYKIILFGGGTHEIATLNTFEASFKNVVTVAGKLNLDEELDIISHLEVMLSMDSGNAHLAAMLGVKVITVWGVTHPFAGFAPFNQPKDYALLADRKQFPKIPTSIYGNVCPENYKKAAGSILPETIVDKIEAVI